MPKFRKRPVEIEAVLWDGSNMPFVSWLLNPLKRPMQEVGAATIMGEAPAATLQIVTLEGVMTAKPGDWIIQGVKGELYPCKPDIFAETYEPIDERPRPS